MLGIAGRRHRFDELSLPRFVAWGTAAGVLVSLLPAAAGLLGVGTWSVPPWHITAALVGPLALGGAIGASGSLALARRAEKREPLDANEDLGDAGLTDETRELLGDGG